MTYLLKRRWSAVVLLLTLVMGPEVEMPFLPSPDKLHVSAPLGCKGLFGVRKRVNSKVWGETQAGRAALGFFLGR